METKAFLVHPSHQGVCGRHGTEDDDVTHGGLVMSEIIALAGQVGKHSRSGRTAPATSKERAVISVMDAIRKPRNAYRTHGEKSESRVLLRNGRTTETSGSVTLV
jgi:hypothetical protein